MIIDGRQIAENLKQEITESIEDKGLVLAVILVGDDSASQKFVKQKKKFGEEIGVEVRVQEYEADITEEDLAAEIEKLANKNDIDGIVVQLPLPKHINTSKILDLIPAQKDVDALTENASVLPPVTGAIKEIIERCHVELEGKRIMVVGKGKLVGRPTAIWLAQEGYDVEVLDRSTKVIEDKLRSADVIISGIGVSKFIKPDMVKSGAVLIDGGTSEDGGAIAGDADPACAEKCSLFTPVPGGVGPITVAMLFKNLTILAKH